MLKISPRSELGNSQVQTLGSRLFCWAVSLQFPEHILILLVDMVSVWLCSLDNLYASKHWLGTF